MTDKKNSAWRSPWVIAWVAMVVIFFTMNLIMIYMATDNSPGLVVDDFYERGQDYEKNMLKRQARDPGWKMRVELPRKIEVDQTVVCRFRVSDKAGQPVQPDGVTFYAYRPSDKDADFSVPMKLVAPGLYEAEVRFPLLGAWDTLVSARKGEDEFNTPKRIGVGMDWVP
ncbi:MAG: FixH family protein [Gammaproteobacteria bacterium]|nr:FixH family protein [Gammaproteobacteria bacterium]